MCVCKRGLSTTLKWVQRLCEGACAREEVRVKFEDALAAVEKLGDCTGSHVDYVVALYRQSSLDRSLWLLLPTSLLFLRQPQPNPTSPVPFM